MFHENKNIIRTFCGWQSHQNFTGSYKNSLEALDELQDTQSIKR